MAGMATTSGRHGGYHHGDLRNALERAALELVAQNGVHGFTLAEASRRAGVSVAAPFRHFASKEALLVALALRGYQEQERRFAAAIVATDDPVEQLAAFAVAYVRFAVEQRPLFEINFRAGLDKSRYPELEAAGGEVLRVLNGPAGELRPHPADALALVHAVGAVAHGYASFLHEGVFGTGEDAVARAEEGARAAARALARGRP